MNATAEKFQYPDSLVGRFDHWLVLLRPAQVTLGSLVLVCTDPARRFGEISPEASRELQRATDAIERHLGELLQFDRINYLMLMMVAPGSSSSRYWGYFLLSNPSANLCSSSSSTIHAAPWMRT